VIVGGEAVIYYGHVRLTGDLDIFYDRSASNIKKLYAVLKEFWGEMIPALDGPDDMSKVGMIIQFGIPPNRIDLINEIENVKFIETLKSREIAEIKHEGKLLKIYFISLDLLIRNKQSINRPRDAEDLKFLLRKKSQRSRFD
jgi:hypothetical protein